MKQVEKTTLQHYVYYRYSDNNKSLANINSGLFHS